MTVCDGDGPLIGVVMMHRVLGGRESCITEEAFLRDHAAMLMKALALKEGARSLSACNTYAWNGTLAPRMSQVRSGSLSRLSMIITSRIAPLVRAMLWSKS